VRPHVLLERENTGTGFKTVPCRTLLRALLGRKGKTARVLETCGSWAGAGSHRVFGRLFWSYLALLKSPTWKYCSVLSKFGFLVPNTLLSARFAATHWRIKLSGGGILDFQVLLLFVLETKLSYYDRRRLPRVSGFFSCGGTLKFSKLIITLSSSTRVRTCRTRHAKFSDCSWVWGKR